MGYACDVEPHHPEAILHPIAIMIPTALAMAERQRRSGADLVGAVALGCEVEYRVSMALQPAELYALGFHPSAVAGCFGATAAACHLLGLRSEAVQRALGLAACQASGMMAWESDPTENARPFQMGVAARNGITSAMLAASGFGGPVGIFDHGHTLFRAFSRNPAPAKLTDRLGKAWDGVVELAIKPYSCVSFLHPALDALLGLVRENGLVAEDISAITLRFPKDGIHCVDGNPLKSHCAQYVLPLAVANGELRVSDIFVDRRVSDSRIAALCKRVRVVSDPALDPLFPDFYASIVDIECSSGKSYSRRNDIARGYPEAPLPAEELDGKFERLCLSVTNDEGLAHLRRALDGLSTAPSVRGLADALREARPA